MNVHHLPDVAGVEYVLAESIDDRRAKLLEKIVVENIRLKRRVSTLHSTHQTVASKAFGLGLVFGALAGGFVVAILETGDLAQIVDRALRAVGF